MIRLMHKRLYTLPDNNAFIIASTTSLPPPNPLDIRSISPVH